MTEHAPAVFALALAFFLGGGARDVGPLVCPPACAYLSACQPASCPPRPRPTLPCPDRYIDFSLPPAPQDGPPVPSSCLTPPTRFALPFLRRPPAFRIFMPNRPPFQPACLALSQVPCLRRRPCASSCTTWQARSACLPSARLHRLWSFRGSVCSMCLPPLTSCTFLEQATPQLWAASSRLACVAR